MLYTYRCSECGKTDEVQHSIKEDPEIRCDSCQAVMRRMIETNPQILFIGDDWPGKQANREAEWGSEDAKIMHAKQKSRELRASGEMGPDDRITLEDVRRGRVPD